MPMWDLIVLVATLRAPMPICTAGQETFCAKLEPPVAQARLIIGMNFGWQQQDIWTPSGAGQGHKAVAAMDAISEDPDVEFADRLGGQTSVGSPQKRRARGTLPRTEPQAKRPVVCGPLEPVVKSWIQVRGRWPHAVMTKIAVLVGWRPDGLIKTRLFVGRWRSGINGWIDPVKGTAMSECSLARDQPLSVQDIVAGLKSKLAQATVISGDSPHIQN